jgi:hypothetical protein
MSLPAEYFVVRDVTDPRGVVRVLRDHWWWCLDGDHQRAVFYIGRTKRPRAGSPQCNSNRSITERIKVPFEQAVIRRIPIAFVPVEE